MVDYEYGALFNEDSVKKEVIITYGNTTITNEDLFNQELELDESLCSEEQLKFGSCEASVIKFKVANIVSPIKGQWINVSMAIGGHNENPIQLGVYKVESDKPTSDRKWREIVAYDALYDMINDDVSDWYNSVLPGKNTSMPLAQFRKLFLQKYGVQEEADETLVNDGMIVTRTIEPDELSGAKVITAICELNGCFGHIGRNGKFKNVHLVQGIKGLYPRNDLYPSDDLYPRDPKTTPIGKGIYITCEYEDFVTIGITGVDIYKEENLIGSSAGDSGNKYAAEDNFLVYGKTDQEISTIANNLLSAIRGVDYRPFDAECKGNPCFEVGDPVRFSTKYEIVESYILSRTLKGTQALKDSYSADGAEKYETKVNSVRRETSQLYGKTEQLERVSEEHQEHIDNINSDICDINSGIDEINDNIGDLEESVEKNRVSIEKTEESLSVTIAGSQEEWDETGYSIEYYGYGEPVKTYPPINESSIGKRYLDESENMVYRCVRDANGIRWGWPEKYTGQQVDYRGSGKPVVGYPPDDESSIGKYYLDQTSGKVYRCVRDANGIRWDYPQQLTRITVKLDTAIRQTQESVTIEANRAKGAEDVLSSRISVEAGNIVLESSRARGAEESLSGRISVAESNINLKVSKGEVISSINLSPEAVDIDASKINLNGAVTANSNFKINLDGTVESTGGIFDQSCFTQGIYLALNRWNTSYKYPVVEMQSAGYMNFANSSTDTTFLGSLHFGNVASVYPTANRMQVSGELYANSNVYFSGVYGNSTTADPNLHITPTGYLNTKGGSSKNWKHDIGEIKSEFIDPHKLYDVECRQFIYNDDYISENDCRRGKFIPGFIIEELLETYPIAVDIDENGNPATWSPSMFIAPIIYLLQEQNKRIETLEKSMLKGEIKC